MRRFCCWSLVALFAVSGCEYFQKKELVYVTASVLNLRDKPSTRSNIIGRLKRGHELEVVQRGETWLEVKASEKYQGWVHGNYVGDLEAVRAALQKELKRGKSGQRRVVSRSRTTPQKKTGSKGFSIDGMLTGFPEGLEIEVLDPIGGQPRSMGGTSNGQVVVEFWGNPRDLTRAEIMVSVVDVSYADLAESATLAAEFIRNAVPAWKRDGTWMVDKLKELTSKDVGTGNIQSRTKTVRFEFIKPLGSVRITVEKMG